MVPIVITLIVAFALFALTRTILRYRDKKISLVGLVFWSVLWLGLIGVAVFPIPAASVTISLGVDRPLDAVAYASIMILFYLTFRLYVMYQETQKDISKVVEELALQKKK